jgi:hypothetical protein
LKIEIKLEKSMKIPGMWQQFLSIRWRKILTITQWICNSKKDKIIHCSRHLFWGMSDHKELSILEKNKAKLFSTLYLIILNSVDGVMIPLTPNNLCIDGPQTPSLILL